MNYLLELCHCIDAHLVYDIDAIRDINSTRLADVCQTSPRSSTAALDDDEKFNSTFECTQNVFKLLDNGTYDCNECRVPCRLAIKSRATECSLGNRNDCLQ